MKSKRKFSYDFIFERGVTRREFSCDFIFRRSFTRRDGTRAAVASHVHGRKKSHQTTATRAEWRWLPI
jgi:hypothetical protein